MINLYNHQVDALEKTKYHDNCAYYLDMGLGKTYIGSEKMKQLNKKLNLVVCQKSKIEDWKEHFIVNYGADFVVYDLTIKNEFEMFMRLLDDIKNPFNFVGIINYDLLFRKNWFLKLKNFALLLDESSVIQNDTSRRSKFIARMTPSNVILLSGTPTSGRYERLYSQLRLLGWDIEKKLYLKHYVNYETIKIGTLHIKKVVGYKNVDRLKDKLKQYGAIFMKTEEVLDLPEQLEQTIIVNKTKEYNHFMKHSIITVNANGKFFKDDSDFSGTDISPRFEFVGDMTLTKLLYLRFLANGYNYNKLVALKDLIESSDDRLIIFYNFNQELEIMKQIIGDRPTSIVNGETKNLDNYNNYSNSITLVQYQSGAMGINLQKANKIIYFSLTTRSELFEQSKKRIHRIGQNNNCFYYYLISKNTIDEDIFENLKMRRDYNDALFKSKYM